jgi:hypothetical protein
MKSIHIILLLSITTQAILSQDTDTSYWSSAGKFGINFSQVGLTNWASGGDPTVSFNGLFTYGLKFEKEPHLWINKLDAGYGVQRIGHEGEPFKKTDDKIVVTTRYGYRINKKWYASALADFRTQFYEGYSYEKDTSRFISAFMAPAYLKMGIGVSYNHRFSEEEYFSVTLAPLNTKTTFVLDDTLSARGAFGIDPGEQLLFQAGVDLSMTLNKELVKNVTLSTTLGLFSKYTDLAVVDVNWDMVVWFRINQYLSATISTQLIYDQDVTVIDSEGNPVNSLVQFKEVLGIGFTLAF